MINSAPPRRQDVELPMVTYARENLLELGIPVWGGQVTQREILAGFGRRRGGQGIRGRVACGKRNGAAMDRDRKIGQAITGALARLVDASRCGLKNSVALKQEKSLLRWRRLNRLPVEPCRAS